MLATKVEIGRTKTFGRRTALIILSNSRRVCVSSSSPSVAFGYRIIVIRRALRAVITRERRVARTHSLTRPGLAFVTSLLSTNPRGRRARDTRGIDMRERRELSEYCPNQLLKTANYGVFYPHLFYGVAFWGGGGGLHELKLFLNSQTLTGAKFVKKLLNSIKVPPYANGI